MNPMPVVEKSATYKMAYTLTYIGATWCKTCKDIKPAVEALVQRYAVPMNVLDYDEDLNDEEKETIRKVPTLRITRGGGSSSGEQVAEFTVRQVDSLREWLAENIALAATGDTDF
jgi:thiol-disulfide isomerase/thioredoxin